MRFFFYTPPLLLSSSPPLLLSSSPPLLLSSSPPLLLSSSPPLLLSSPSPTSLQARLADLSEKKKLLSRRITEASSCVNGGELREDQEFEHDAAERQYWLLTIEDKLRSAAQQMQMSSRELEMLSSLSQEQKDQAVNEYQQQINDSRGRAPHPSQLKVIEEAPTPVVLTQLNMDRERILAEVFMDRNPATMSDAEYCDQQMARMQPSAPPGGEKKEVDSDSEDDGTKDMKRKKASHWDDWKDDHAQDGNMGSNIG